MRQSTNIFLFLAFVFIILISSNQSTLAQCTLTGSTSGNGTTYNAAQVLGAGCLGNSTCPCTITISEGRVNIDGIWDLTSKGNISIIIDGSTNILNFNNNAELRLTAGSSIQITNSGSMTYSGTAGDIKIRKGTVNYDGDDFSTLNSQGGVLPVQLALFEGSLNQQSIVLTWQTSTELNNAKFIIETSHLGETFQPLGEVAGAGTTTEPQNYSFTHHTPSTGINYYRLKQVDFDGTFEYSKVIAIEAAGSQDIFAFPNPARDKVTLQYDQSKGAGNIQLLDGLGRRIQARITGYAGNYELSLPESLARGTYWLKVERGGKVQTLPVVKE